MTKRCGYIALLGRPNAGKSTLLNALVGDKIAVVSRKPQTTRNRILGIGMVDQTQILFLDTPGIHKTRRNLINTTMNRVAMHTASEADLAVYLIDAAAGMTDEDHTYLGRILENTQAPVVVLLTKIDALKKFEVEDVQNQVAQALETLTAAIPGSAGRIVEESPVPCSAKRPESVAALKGYLASYLPDGPWLYPADDLTDMPRSFIAAELVREQLFRQLGQEVPYGSAVKVESIEFKPDIVVVKALIVLARASHKPIVLGKGGAQIKAIGTAARASLESHFDKRVYLDLSVSVAEGWIDDQKLIAELAHLSDDIDIDSLQENDDEVAGALAEARELAKSLSDSEPEQPEA